MKNLRLLCLLLLSIFFCEAFAQDIHFSQYFASPLTLNPAATGNFYGSFRVAANYRNQWFGPISNNAPYQTFSGSFDVSVLKQELDIDHMGFGIMFFNDRAGDGNLTTQSVMLSAAYHKGLDSRDKHHIGFGVQGGMVQKRVDFSKLKFEEQWDGESSFNPALWNHENVRAESILYPDFNFGVFGQTTLSDNVNANIGFGYYHVFTPTESFLQNNNNELDPKFVAHGALNAAVGDYIVLSPGFLYLNQSNASEITPGAAVSFSLADEANAYLGAWYRVNDAIIPYAGFEYGGARLGVSYNLNASDLNSSAKHVGGVEISLVYIHKEEEPSRFNPVKYCPRF